METQLSFMSKEEAHKLIDSIPSDGIYVFTYSEKTGISNNGKIMKKKKGNKMIDKAKVIVLSKSQITTLNLHDIFFNDFNEYRREGIIRTIMIPKLE